MLLNSLFLHPSFSSILWWWKCTPNQRGILSFLHCVLVTDTYVSLLESTRQCAEKKKVMQYGVYIPFRHFPAVIRCLSSRHFYPTYVAVMLLIITIAIAGLSQTTHSWYLLHSLLVQFPKKIRNADPSPKRDVVFSLNLLMTVLFVVRRRTLKVWGNKRKRGTAKVNILFSPHA